MPYATRTIPTAARRHGVEPVEVDPSWTRQDCANPHPLRTAEGTYLTARYLDADGMVAALELHEDRPYYATGRARWFGEAEVLPALDADGEPIVTALDGSAGIGGYSLGYVFACDQWCATCAAAQVMDPDADPSDPDADGDWPVAFVADGDPDEYHADAAGAAATLAHLTEEHGMAPEDVARLAGVKDPARLIGSGDLRDSVRLAEAHERAHALGIMRTVTAPLPLFERCRIAPEGVQAHRPHLGGSDVCRLAAVALAAHTVTEPDHEADDHRRGWTSADYRDPVNRWGIEPDWSDVPYFTCGGCYEGVH